MSRLLLSCCALLLQAQTIDLVPVRSQTAAQTLELPGEIMAYQQVALHARVNGYVDSVLVDRGSAVRQGQLLVTLSAPELEAQTAELESRLQSSQSAKAEAEAQAAAAQATYDRLKEASTTQGAVAGNELIQAEKRLEAERAAVESGQSAVKAAGAALTAARQMQSYLKLTAPFSGVITDRFVHPGALVGPGSGSAGAMLELQQITRLRLVVPVPEAAVAGTQRGAEVKFRVPAYPGRTFTGNVARIDHALDPRTRTMPVELDVRNPRSELAPGMYPQVTWSVKSSAPVLLVPPAAVVTTTERTFVIRVRNNRAEWVNVKKIAVRNEAVEVSGPLRAGDLVVRRATDEIRDGAPATGTRQSPAQAAQTPR